jgi:hypothetical protein
MTATKFRGSIHSSFFHQEDDPRSHSIKPLPNIWEKPPYVVPSSNWSSIRNEWVNGIGHQETYFGNPQEFRVAGVSLGHAASRSSEFLDAANVAYDRWAPGGGRLDIPNAQARSTGGFSALRIGDSKSAVHSGVAFSIAGNIVFLAHGSNLFPSMMEASATESAGQASLRHPGAFMVPSRRYFNLDAGRALVGRVEDYHEVPNAISLKVPSGTGSLPMPDLVDYVSRIQELRSFGEEEDITVSRDSESDFWRFVFQFPSEQPGNLMLMQDGDLRWIWKGDDLAHVGIRFIGSGRGRYVIFKRRAGEFHVSRVSGEDNLEGVVQQVRSFDVTLFGNDSKQGD